MQQNAIINEVSEISDDDNQTNEDELREQAIQDNYINEETESDLQQNNMENEQIEIENNEDGNNNVGEIPTDAPPRGDGRARSHNAGRGVNRLDMDTPSKTYGQIKVNRKGSQFVNLKKRANRRPTKNKKGFQLLMKKIGKDEKESNHVEYMNKCMKILCTQFDTPKQEPKKDMPALQGLKLWGEEALTAILKEFSQMNKGPKGDDPVVKPVDPNTLTAVEKKAALSAVNLIKRKRNGNVKARTCANGSKQRQYLGVYDSVASPTVSFEAQVSTLLIDAKEEREVVTYDIPGAYLHADMPEEKKLFLKLRGRFVDIMCQVVAGRKTKRKFS